MASQNVVKGNLCMVSFPSNGHANVCEEVAKKKIVMMSSRMTNMLRNKGCPAQR